MPALKTRTLTSAALLPLLIVLLAALVRFVYPGVVEFKHDEATLSLLALDWLDGGAFPLTGMPSSVGVPNAPASVYVIALPFALGADALAATLFVAGLNVLGVGLLWFIAYRYLGTAPALVAGLVYALNPWAILYSRKIWAQDFHTPFLLLALLLGLYGFLEGRRWAQILCLPVLLFALQIHFAAWVLLPLYLWLLIAGGRRVSLPALLVSIVMGGLVMLPFALGIMQTLEHEPDRITGALNSADRALTLGEEALVFNAALATGTGIASEITPDQEHLIAPEMDILRPVWLVVYGAALLLGLVAIWRDGWRLAGLVWLWALLPLLVFSVRWTPVHPAYFIASLPAFALLIGAGVALPVRVMARRALPLRSIAFLLTALFCLLPLTQALYWLALMTFIDTNATPAYFGIPLRYRLPVRDALANERDVLVLTDGFEMALDQEPVIWSVLLHGTADCVRALAGEELLVLPAQPFTALVAPNAPEVPLDNFYATASSQYYPLRPGDGAYVLHRFQRAPEWRAAALTPILPTRFDNGAQLVGYALSPDRVHLRWLLPGAASEDYQYFVHLLDAEGNRLAQQDGRFWPGRYWCAGDTLMTSAALSIPDGVQTLRVGLYTLQPGGGFANANVVDEAGGALGVWADIVVDN